MRLWLQRKTSPAQPLKSRNVQEERYARRRIGQQHDGIAHDEQVFEAGRTTKKRAEMSSQE